jgi:hypothetical protein
LRNQQIRYVCQKINFIVVGSHDYFAITYWSSSATLSFASLCKKLLVKKSTIFNPNNTIYILFMVNFKFACQHCQSWQPDCSGIKIIQIFIVTTIFRYSWSCGRIHQNCVFYFSISFLLITFGRITTPLLN